MIVATVRNPGVLQPEKK